LGLGLVKRRSFQGWRLVASLGFFSDKSRDEWDKGRDIEREAEHKRERSGEREQDVAILVEAS